MYVDNDKLSYSPAQLFILRERNNLSWNRNLYSTQIPYLRYWANILRWDKHLYLEDFVSNK